VLSRVADALYWMGRYVERAEHSARLLEVIRRADIDLAESFPTVAEEQWQDALRILSLPERTRLVQAVFEEQLVGSVASSMTRARENARQVREVISAEMWDYLNQAHWLLAENRKSRSRQELVSDTLVSVIRASFLWGGVVDATMSRGPGWSFTRLGQFVERGHRTAHTFAVQWRSLERRGGLHQAEPSHNIGWLTLLRSCGSLDEYRKLYPARIDPQHIVDFVLLGPTYPRTVRYAIRIASELAGRLATEAHGRGRRAGRAFGKLAATIEYADVEEVMAEGVGTFIERVDEGLVRASTELQREFFFH
jgi:uncharacterized alpha-E superfamily protein